MLERRISPRSRASRVTSKMGVRAGDELQVELTLLPGAEGPPVHFHRGFEENFVVHEGQLELLVDGELHQLGPGDNFVVHAGQAHRPANPGSEAVVLRGEDCTIPRSFSACLAQLYSVMDEKPPAEHPMSMALQMSVIDPICDTHLAGPPPAMLELSRWLLAPAARLAGYRNYYPERALHPPA